MPKGKVDVPISDKEIRFAHLLLAGEMTDRQAAEAAGLKPSTADYVKAKPRLKAYMEEYRQAVRAAVVKHEAKMLIKFEITPEQLLQRLWQIANLSPEETRGSMNAQVLAVKELLDRVEGRAREVDKESAKPDIYIPEWMRKEKTEIS
jgi:hypothetical protein